jgi:hypothetical protein
MDVVPSPCGAAIDGAPACNATTDTGTHQHLVRRAVVALILCFAGTIEPDSAHGSAANVDDVRITRADQDWANWMTYGRTYSEQRFSPLARITADNAKQLGLAWYAELDTNRDQEATSLVMWQRGFRRNSPEAMALFAKKLNDQEVAAVAAYYQQVRSSDGAATSK